MNEQSHDVSGGPSRTEHGIGTWEAAYLRFETPEQEIGKFVRRLLKAGAGSWPRDAEILELFCGRGNGLQALGRLGFSKVKGLDRSASLVARYAGPAQCHVGDARRIPFDAACADIVIIQGGLHHLEALPNDLDRVLSEACRVLRGDGRLVVVEPWLTPFLSLVHAVCRSSVARRLSRRVDALATMIDCERDTYSQWLSDPQMIFSSLKRYFAVEQCVVGWGKLLFVGRKRRAIVPEPHVMTQTGP